MTRHFITATLVFWMGVQINTTYPQDSIQVKSTFDTLDLSRKVAILPNQITTSLSGLGYFVQIFDDPTLLKFSSGTSVFNSLHGFVPGLPLSPDFIISNPFPYTQFAIAVDGISYHSSIAGYTAFNGFDVQQVVALGHENAALLMGGGAVLGAIAVESKSGENIEGPTFDFNSQATRGHTGDDGRNHFSNVFAYMQDFGKIDTRFSYNYITSGYDESGTDYRFRQHNFKLNMGWTQSPDLKLRLLLEKSKVPESPDVGGSNFSNANLSFTYNAPSYSITSRWFTQKIDHLNRNRIEVRSGGNVMAHLKRELNRFTLRAQGGLVGESLEETHGLRVMPYPKAGLVMNANINYNEQVFLDPSYRKEFLHNVPGQVFDFYAGSLAWVVSETFKLNSSTLSWAKLRINAGHWAHNRPEQFTRNPDAITSFYNRITLDARRRVEAGIDLGFLGNRLQLNVNAYQWRINSLGSLNYTGGHFFFVDYSDLKFSEELKGESFFLTLFPGSSGIWTSRLMLYTLRLPYNNNFPNAYGSFYNLVKWKNYSFSGLVESLHGGTYYNYNYNGNYKQTSVIIRDISIGFDVPQVHAEKLRLKALGFYLVGRNQWLLYGEVPEEPEFQDSTSRMYKTLSLGLNATF